MLPYQADVYMQNLLDSYKPLNEWVSGPHSETDVKSHKHTSQGTADIHIFIFVMLD